MRKRRLSGDERAALAALWLRSRDGLPLETRVGPAIRRLAKRGLVQRVSRWVADDCSSCVEIVRITSRGLYTARDLFELPHPQKPTVHNPPWWTRRTYRNPSMRRTEWLDFQREQRKTILRLMGRK